MPRLTYPTPPTADQVDDFHGTLVADPYRPLGHWRARQELIEQMP